MKVPVIPVAVVGTNVVAPPGRTFGTFTRPVVRFGRPLDFSRYEGLESDRYILRSITDEIMYEIMRLSGQEYVDMYSSRAKDLAAKQAQEAKEAARRAKAAGGSEPGLPEGADETTERKKAS
jgi:1-acyl-sn-glycerol-3-phosphate acyltransferase